MAGKVGPDISENGLVLYLDAGNRASYPGSGTTWTDISGNSNTGTLTNGPTFNNGNMGSIVFDGVNDYISLGTFNNFGNSNRTVCCWAKSTNTSGGSHRVVTFPADDTATDTPSIGISLSSNQFGFFWGGTPYNGNINGSYTIGSWVYLTLTITSGQAGIGYVNGLSIGSATSTGTVVTNPIGYIGRYNGNFGQYLEGSVASLCVYNRVLTATEILQNYNATKRRFGL